MTSAAPPATTDNRLSPEVRRAGVVVVLGTIMAILDTTIVAVALPTLAKDFHVTVNTIQWVTTGYLLSLAVVIPLSGWAMHRFGGKPVYITSLLLFVAGSALCGLAWSASALIAFRILQGFGGGMIMPVGQAIMARTAGPDKMNRVMAVIGIPTLLGPILGPVIGGAIVSNVSWRWIFYVNVPIGIVALILAVRFLETTPVTGSTGSTLSASCALPRAWRCSSTDCPWWGTTGASRPGASSSAWWAACCSAPRSCGARSGRPSRCSTCGCSAAAASRWPRSASS